MRNNIFKNLLIICFSALIFININAEASIGISPVKLKFNNDEIIQSTIVQNMGNVLKNFQVKVYKIVLGNGTIKEQYVKTNDLIATPMMFKLAYGLSQLVHVAIVNKNIKSVNHNLQRLYTVEIKEIVPVQVAGPKNRKNR